MSLGYVAMVHWKLGDQNSTDLDDAVTPVPPMTRIPARYNIYVLHCSVLIDALISTYKSFDFGL